jgi:hypothetical protein
MASGCKHLICEQDEQGLILKLRRPTLKVLKETFGDDAIDELNKHLGKKNLPKIGAPLKQRTGRYNLCWQADKLVGEFCAGQLNS